MRDKTQIIQQLVLPHLSSERPRYDRMNEIWDGSHRIGEGAEGSQPQKAHHARSGDFQPCIFPSFCWLLVCCVSFRASH
jgi:hypothetical protein